MQIPTGRLSSNSVNGRFSRARRQAASEMSLLSIDSCKDCIYVFRYNESRDRCQVSLRSVLMAMQRISTAITTRREMNLIHRTSLSHVSRVTSRLSSLRVQATGQAGSSLQGVMDLTHSRRAHYSTAVAGPIGRDSFSPASHSSMGLYRDTAGLHPFKRNFPEPWAGLSMYKTVQLMDMFIHNARLIPSGLSRPASPGTERVRANGGAGGMCGGQSCRHSALSNRWVP